MGPHGAGSSAGEGRAWSPAAVCASAAERGPLTGGGSAVSAETATVMLLLEGVVEEDGRQACAEEILRLAGELGGEQLDEAVAAAIEDFGGTRDGVTEYIVARTAGRLACADGTQTD